MRVRLVFASVALAIVVSILIGVALGIIPLSTAANHVCGCPPRVLYNKNELILELMLTFIFITSVLSLITRTRA